MVWSSSRRPPLKVSTLILRPPTRAHPDVRAVAREAAGPSVLVGVGLVEVDLGAFDRGVPTWREVLRFHLVDLLAQNLGADDVLRRSATTPPMSTLRTTARRRLHSWRYRADPAEREVPIMCG